MLSVAALKLWGKTESLKKITTIKINLEKTDTKWPVSLTFLLSDLLQEKKMFTNILLTTFYTKNRVLELIL